MASKEEIEKTYGRDVILADRDMVEQERYKIKIKQNNFNQSKI